MNNALELKDVSKQYDGFLLDHIDLELPYGCIMGLIGENGAGKSTLIKLIMDVISRDSGMIKILGQDNKEAPKSLKEEIGVVLDESCVPDNLKLGEVDLIMRNIYRKWDGNVFRTYAERFSLTGNKTIKDYSHGMRMKLGIAIALSHDPRLLIMDEATSGLDPIAREEILDVFLEFIQDENRSVLICSHITSDLEKICDYITCIHKGKIVFNAEKDDLIENYGILKCSAADFETIDKSLVEGFRKNEYGVQALVRKGTFAENCIVDRANIEDIMMYQTKEK